MNKIQAKKMLKLADFLEDLHNKKTKYDPTRFHLGVWRANTEEYNQYLIDEECTQYLTTEELTQDILLPIPACGTSACAVGHIQEVFPRSGFTFVRDEYSRTFFPRYKGHETWEAVTAFFGIDLDDAVYLFGPVSYDDPAKIMPVVKRLREFVKVRTSVS